MLDTWIYALPSAWAAIAPSEADMEAGFPAVYEQAVTGFWLTYTGGFEVYNVLGSQSEIQAIVDALETEHTGSVAHVFSWIQGSGLDSLESNITIPADVLAVMKPHVVHNQDGSVASSTPASYERPNWGHVFLGQSERIFAGDFSDEFSGEFF
ncbi:MAG: hypothetical protein AB2747_05390 [Candidatus Thiodiazotropha taylori]